MSNVYKFCVIYVNFKGGGVHPNYFAILDLRLVVAEGPPHMEETFGTCFGSPLPLGADLEASWGGLSESPWSPEYRNIIIFRLGKK